MLQKTDEEIIHGVAQHDRAALEWLYRHCLPLVRGMVLQNGGTSDDAWDLFQNVMVLLYQKTKREELQLTSSLTTWLYAVCKNLWFKELRKRKNMIPLTNPEELGEKVGEYQDLWHAYEEINQEWLYQKHFIKLHDDCQKILRMFYDKVPIKEIMKVLGYKSYSYLKKRKHICKERLIKSIKKDPNFKRYLNEE